MKWRDLNWLAIIAWVGPIAPLLVLVKVIWELPFWDKNVIPQRAPKQESDDGE